MRAFVERPMEELGNLLLQSLKSSRCARPCRMWMSEFEDVSECGLRDELLVEEMLDFQPHESLNGLR